MKITEERRQQGLKMIEDGGDYEAFDKFLNKEYFMFNHSHDKRIEWETIIMGYVYEHAGPEALWITMASVTPQYWQPMIDAAVNGTYKDAVLQQIAGLETHGQPLEIMEDDEKVVVWMRPCGSGTFLMETRHVYDAPQNCARCKACPQTWNIDNFPRLLRPRPAAGDSVHQADRLAHHGQLPAARGAQPARLPVRQAVLRLRRLQGPQRHPRVRLQDPRL